MHTTATSLPDGWTTEEAASGAYTKYVHRDAVKVPKRYSGEPFHRDAVVIASATTAGVVKGPGARSSWDTEDPDALARALVDVVDDWIQDDRDPYGGQELRDRLDEAVEAHQ